MTSTVETQPFSAALGAAVTGVDLRTASDDDVAAVRSAILDHHVVAIPGQSLNDDEHESFMARLGDLHFHPFLEIMDVPPSYHEKINQTKESPPGVDHWHTDLIWYAEPVAFGSLFCVQAPSYGGGTEFANLVLAYDQLHERWKNVVDGLECVYGISGAMLDNFARYFGDDARKVWTDAFSGATHPLVRTHPETGRNALYLSPDTGPVVREMGDHGGKHIINYLVEHCTRPNVTARWSWSAGDLVIWDERCTMHYGVRDGYPGDRKMRRVLVNGDKPFYSGA